MIVFYKPPILTVVFRLLGVLFLIVSIVAGIVTLLQGAGAVPAEAGAGGKEHVWAAVGVFAGGLLGALLYWGFAQVIDFLGRTAFFTEQIYVRAATQAGVRPKERAADTVIEGTPEVPAGGGEKEAELGKPPPAGERTKFACTACGQRISAMTSEIGNHIACPNCGEDVVVA